MSYYELFASPSLFFGGIQAQFEEAAYVILGVPFDATSTYRSGARFAPSAIREASLNMETYSLRSDSDLEELKIHDLGDLNVSGKVDETLKRLHLVVKDLVEAQKTPVVVGGEHTITLGSTQAVKNDVTLVSFDAHLDLRNEYMDRRVSHTTFMRRIKEQVSPERILEIGTRAVCREELDYAQNNDIQYLSSQAIRKNGTPNTLRTVRDALDECRRIYLTVDMDVLDPAFAPAVQNPEPDGLSMQTVLDILSNICDERVVGLDLVEVTPHYDQGITAFQAAKILFEALCHIEKTRRR